MYIITQFADLRKKIAQWRSANSNTRLAFVPTMGNLHSGHLALVQAAQQHATQVVVSIFVNPLQFSANEDLETYPRTLNDDQQQLVALGCDVLFTPLASAMYPQGQHAQTRVEVPELSHILCGASRSGHFVGVATVVCKLLNIVQPDVAFFGEKDFQQVLVIRRMVSDLNLPIEIISLPTVRAADGLALSSRNGYLSPEQRARAPLLFQTLQTASAALQQGATVADVEQQAISALRAADFQVDYVVVRAAATLAPATAAETELVILAAASLGQTRLIDNVRIRLRTTGNDGENDGA